MFNRNDLDFMLPFPVPNILAAGTTPAEALAAVQRAASDDAAYAAVVGFVCYCVD